MMAVAETSTPLVEPRRLRLERRLNVTPGHAALARVGGVLVALIVAAVILALTGRNPLSLMWKSLDGTFGERQGLEEMGVLLTPILMNALAVHVALRMKIWNIGSEGQFFMGAWAAAGIGIYWTGPRYLVLLVMAMAAALAGAAWIVVPALARARWQVNEIITTLLLNFVAIQWVAWFSFDLWRDRAASVVQSTPVVQARMPFFPGSTTLFVSVLVPFIVAAGMFVVFRYTRWGYEVDMIGGNPRAAEFAGIRVARRIVVVMLISGAIAGVSGMLHLAGPAQRLNSSISNNYGLSGFIVAALAGSSVLGLVAGSIFIASMLHAGITLQSDGLSVFVVAAVYGLVLLGIAVGEVAGRYRVVRSSGLEAVQTG
jgi:general nucleoside transport system permease protein